MKSMPYYSKGLGIYCSPERTKKADGTFATTMGFLVGRVDENVKDPEKAAQTIAKAMNLMEDADTVEQMQVKINAVYEERNRLVALLARVYSSGISRTNIEGWDPSWHNVVYIDSPMGQLSWHYHDRDAHLFADLDFYPGTWDGHSTEEKYGRLEQLTRNIDSMRLLGRDLSTSGMTQASRAGIAGLAAVEAAMMDPPEPPVDQANMGGPQVPLPQTYTDWLAGRDDELGKLQASLPSPEDGKR
jgi:hypothetical protein